MSSDEALWHDLSFFVTTTHKKTEHPTTNDNLALWKYGKQSRESQENLERLEN